MATVIKQPTEIRDISFNLAALIPSGATLNAATAYASQKTTMATTLAAMSNVGDTTVSLTANPGIGSLITLDADGALEEIKKVSAVTGTGPYTATLSEGLDFSHSNGAAVEYEPGVSSTLLVSTTASIQGTLAIIRARRGAAGKTYRLSVVGTLSTGEVVEGECDLSLQEL